MRTLYVSDMDGTLLNNGSFVSPQSAAIIKDLSRQGALITVATARTPATVVPLMAECGVRVPYVVMTGAATFDPVTMTYDSARLIPADDFKRVISMFDEARINPFVYHMADNGFITVYHRPGLTDAERSFYDLRRDLRLKRFTFEPVEARDNVILLFGMGPTASLTPLADAIRATGRFSVSCYPDIYLKEMSLIEVFAIGISKANAITALASRLGVDRIVAFGDNLNDLPMLEIADLAVAVDNAFPAVKEAADIIIGPNYNDSVARFIAKDFSHIQPFLGFTDTTCF